MVQEIIRLIINKSIVPKQPKRRGRKGYSVMLAVRILVYTLIGKVLNDKGPVCIYKGTINSGS